jgi:hypothetical protein
MSSGADDTYLLRVSTSVLVPWAAFAVTRRQFGRVVVEVNDGTLTVTHSIRLRPTGIQLERSVIGGFWVAWENSDGRTGLYSLMVDRDASKSVRLSANVSNLVSLVFLSESLARRLEVPSYTRGSELA